MTTTNRSTGRAQGWRDHVSCLCALGGWQYRARTNGVHVNVQEMAPTASSYKTVRSMLIEAFDHEYDAIKDGRDWRATDAAVAEALSQIASPDHN